MYVFKNKFQFRLVTVRAIIQCLNDLGVLRQYVKIVKRADVVQTTGPGATAPNDLELVLECVHTYDSLIMAITRDKSNIKFN